MPTAASCASLDTLHHHEASTDSGAHTTATSGVSSINTTTAASSICSKKRKSSQKSDTYVALRNPIFDADFTFDVEREDLGSYVLQIMVKEKMGPMEKNVLLGVVKFRLSEAKLTQGLECVMDLWRDVLPLNINDVSRGEVLLCLKFNHRTGRLHVYIRQCRDLAIKEKVQGRVNAKISLVTADNLIKSKETKYIREDLENAEFPENDVLQFKLDPSLLHTVACMIQILFSKKTVLSSAHTLGRCVVGPVTLADGEGLDHWTDMCESQGMEVARWHNLI